MDTKKDAGGSPPSPSAQSSSPSAAAAVADQGVHNSHEDAVEATVLDRQTTQDAGCAEGLILALTEPSTEFRAAQDLGNDLNQQDREAKRAAMAASNAGSTRENGADQGASTGDGGDHSVSNNKEFTDSDAAALNMRESRTNPSAGYILALTEESTEFQAVQQIGAELSQQDRAAKNMGNGESGIHPSYHASGEESNTRETDHRPPARIEESHSAAGDEPTALHPASPTIHCTKARPDPGGSQPGAFPQRGINSRQEDESDGLVHAEGSAEEAASQSEGEQNVTVVNEVSSGQSAIGIRDDIEAPSVQEATLGNNGPAVETQTNQLLAQDPDQLLIEATLVASTLNQPTPMRVEERDFTSDIAEAKPMDQAEMASSFFRTKAGLSLICLVVVVVTALVIGLLLGIARNVGGNTSPDISQASPGNTQPPLNEDAHEADLASALLLELGLTNSTIQKIIEVPESPQSQALAWMVNNTQLQSMSTLERTQAFALMTIYYSTEGEGWTESEGWGDYRYKVCTWFGSLGQFCDDDGMVVELVLASNDLHGTIPAEVSLLASKLHTLGFLQNWLYGEMPTQIGLLTSLQLLNLMENQLSGSLPVQLGSLLELESILLDNNQFTGEIPVLNCHQSLTDLGLSHNSLRTMRTELGHLTMLDVLDVSRNKLAGLLPSELGHLTLLQDLQLQGNILSGSLPSEIARLTRLLRFQISDNNLWGFIPPSISSMSQLSVLGLAENVFYGPIPTELGLIQKLCVLDLSENTLSGAIPLQLGRLCYGFPLVYQQSSLVPRFYRLMVEMASAANITAMTSKINAVLGEALEKAFDGLETFEIALLGSHLDGGASSPTLQVDLGFTAYFAPGVTSPTQDEVKDVLDNVYRYGSLIPFTWLDVDSSGSNATRTDYLTVFPIFDGDFVFVLDMSHNRLQGSMPGALFGPWSLLEQFNVHSNAIDGSIPIEIGSSSRLRSVDLGDNVITGIVPSNLGQLTSLSMLDLSSNQLSGSIPSQIWSLPNLEVLDLSNNHITGKMKLGSVDLPPLSKLSLRKNSLTGVIPSEVGDMSMLCSIDMADNQLSGRLPQTMSELCFRSEMEKGHTTSFTFTLEFVFPPQRTLPVLSVEQIAHMEHLLENMYSTYKLEFYASFERLHLFASRELVYYGQSLTLEFLVFLLYLDSGDLSHDEIVFAFSSHPVEVYEAYLGREDDFPLFGRIDSVNFTYADLDTTALPPVDLDFSNNNLQGRIPSELASLFTPQSTMRLLGNNFTGALPLELCPWFCATQTPNSSSVFEVDCQQVHCRCSC